MIPLEVIRKKRDNKTLNGEEISFMIRSFTAGDIPDYQFASFLMAVYLNGMSEEETSFLTDAMLHSGSAADLSDIKGIKIDKHSTGGVGDKTSLIVNPIAASAGIIVPMIAGRSLGHTGGTIDKLESITGFNAALSMTAFKDNLKKCGAVFMSQTEEIAPADKLIYALRDVTATVESIPLITASIMSKKLAEGIDGLVLDIKTGSGAFMKQYPDAEKLANSLVKTAERFDKKVTAFITAMDQPLGYYTGNKLEVYECIRMLKGEGLDTDLAELSMNLAGAMLMLGGKVHDLEEGIVMAGELIKSGRAYDKFVEIIRSQGGEISDIEDQNESSFADYSDKVFADKSGYIYEINSYEIGMAAAELGAGRRTKEDKLDLNAGIKLNFKTGDKIRKGDAAAEVYSGSQKGIDAAKRRINNSIIISDSKPDKSNLIKKII